MRRRDFIKAAGCVTIGFSIGQTPFVRILSPQQELPGSLRRHPAINAWLEVLANGHVRILTGKLELGQGIRTAIAQVAAEELDLAMGNVEVTLAETGVTPNEGYTSGSASIEQSAMSVRYAAAAARQKLMELAAKKLKVPEGRLKMFNGSIGTAKGSALAFADILDGKQITDEVRLPVTLKQKDQYKLVGKAVPRDDVDRMTRGEPVFVQDLRFPGMLYARVVRPPAYDAKLLQCNEQAVQAKVPGIIKIVVNGSFLGVITQQEYQSIQAQALLTEHTKWSAGTPLPSDRDLEEYLKSLPVQTERVREKGSKNFTEGVSVLKAAYFKPYIMHGAMGPSCAVALYEKETRQLHIWTHSQGVYPLRETLSRMLDMPAENIHVKGVPGAGCYGHNGADDAAADAALLAMAYPGKHIQLQWSREDEHAWEPYGSAMVMELAAQLNSSGKITHWQYDLWSDTHSTRPGGRPQNLLAAQHLQKPFTGEKSGYSAGAYRNGEPYYSIPNQQINAHFFKGPLRISALRSLGAYANIFAIESFMDELAEKAGTDPYQFRLMHLDDQRAKAVISRLRELTREQPAEPDTGIGIAFARYKNSASYCAVAAQVTVNSSTGDVQLKKMWGVIDAGEAINPDGLKNQTEGGMVQSASWTLLEQVLFNEQQISTRNWTTYPILRYHQCPEVEVVVIDRPDEKAMGAGEAAQGPAGAAIANAIYRACGKRVRRLPVMPENVKE